MAASGIFEAVILKVQRTGKIISKDLKLAQSFLDQLLGLLRPSNPRCLLFKTRFGIHTFFLKKPIDVLILDKQNQVAALKPNLKPNRLFFWNPRFFKVLELPQGTIRKFKIQPKTKLVC